MRDFVALFLYYGGRPLSDPVTADHLSRLVAIEGEANVIPIDVSSAEGWHGPDAKVYEWAKSPAFVPAKRYAIVEWDALATMTLREWWGEAAWAADAAAVWTLDCVDDDPNWVWWGDIAKLPPAYRPYAAGFCPFGVSLLSHDALRAAAESEPAPGVFCELRLGTYLAYHGFEVERKGKGLRGGPVWCSPEMDPASCTTPGLWHPVKTLAAPFAPASLHIITPCSRPENLPALAESIAACPNPHGYPLTWWVVFDADEPGPVPTIPGVTVSLSHREPGWGHAQRNFALEQIRSGLVATLDDDNLLHPGFLSHRYEPGRAYLLTQDRGDRILIPEPRVTQVDSGQIVIDRGLIGGRRFPLGYCGDGEFVEALAAAGVGFERPGGVRAWYNRIRG